MAKCAESALLAAIDVYNKPLAEHREQTLALLLINAWEVLLKARVLQLNDNKLPSIYQRQKGSRRYRRTRTGEPWTIDIWDALNRVAAPQPIRSNLDGLNLVRNQAAHEGLLANPLKRSVLDYGTAAVQNFAHYAESWFELTVRVPYLLPIGFLGAAAAAGPPPNQSQRQLLRNLKEIASDHGDPDSQYAVTIRLRIELNPGFSGGGSIGPTTDPLAPKVRLSDDQALEIFPATYGQILEECRTRYPQFKQNRRFNHAMKAVKEDPECAYKRKLDPRQKGGTERTFYNSCTTLARLDREYRTHAAKTGRAVQMNKGTPR